MNPLIPSNCDMAGHEVTVAFASLIKSVEAVQRCIATNRYTLTAAQREAIHRWINSASAMVTKTHDALRV